MLSELETRIPFSPRMNSIIESVELVSPYVKMAQELSTVITEGYMNNETLAQDYLKLNNLYDSISTGYSKISFDE